MTEIISLPISALVPNDWNPNAMPEEDYDLMVKRFRSRKEVDKPVTARRVDGQEGVFQIIDGEQTWKAAAAAGLSEVPVIVTELDDVDAIATTFVKNLHGVMNPIMVGRNILRMKDAAAAAGRTIGNKEVARKMNKSEGSVRNYLLYVEAADLSGAVEGWPTVEEVAALGVREIREMLDAHKAGLPPAEQPLPLETEDGQNVADVMAEEVKTEKTIAKLLKGAEALELVALRKLRREISKLITEREKATDAPAEGAE